MKHHWFTRDFISSTHPVCMTTGRTPLTNSGNIPTSPNQSDHFWLLSYKLGRRKRIFKDICLSWWSSECLNAVSQPEASEPNHIEKVKILTSAHSESRQAGNSLDLLVFQQDWAKFTGNKQCGGQRSMLLQINKQLLSLNVELHVGGNRCEPLSLNQSFPPY